MKTEKQIKEEIARLEREKKKYGTMEDYVYFLDTKSNTLQWVLGLAG